MTDPAPPATAPVTAAPFTQAALDAVGIPKPADPPPPGGDAPPDTQPAPSPPKPADPPPAAAKSKLELALEAAARVVEKRKAKRQPIVEAETRATALARENAELEARVRAAEAAKPAPTAVALTKAERDAQEAFDASAEGRLAKQERINEELRKRLDDRDRRDEAAAQRYDLEQRERKFIAETAAIVADAPVYPLLAERAKRAPAVVLAEARAIIDQSIASQRAKGTPANRIRIPTNEEIYQYQEWLLAEAVRPMLATAAAAPPAGMPPAPVAPPAKKPSGTRSLSARNAAPAVVPKSFDEMTKAEQLALMASQLKAITPDQP